MRPQRKKTNAALGGARFSPYIAGYYQLVGQQRCNLGYPPAIAASVKTTLLFYHRLCNSSTSFRVGSRVQGPRGTVLFRRTACQRFPPPLISRWFTGDLESNPAWHSTPPLRLCTVCLLGQQPQSQHPIYLLYQQLMCLVASSGMRNLSPLCL